MEDSLFNLVGPEQKPGKVEEVEATEETVVNLIPDLVIDDAFLAKRPLSYSSLKNFRKSPRHYLNYLTEPFVPTEAMKIGSILDCIVLTPHEFEKKFLVYNKVNRSTSKGKAEWANIQSTSRGRTLITKDQLKSAQLAKESLYSENDAKQVLEAMTRTQIKLKWTDKLRNLPIIGYADFEAKLWDELFVVDLKKTASADPQDFVRDYVKYDYLFQTGVYREGYKRIRFRFPYFLYLCVETQAPYGVSVNFIDAKTLELAEQEFHGTLIAFRKCMDEGRFNETYHYKLSGSMPYFSLQVPGYYKPKYIGIDE